MHTLDLSEIPKDVIDAATTVTWFFKNRGLSQWRLGEIQSAPAPASIEQINERQAQLLEDALLETAISPAGRVIRRRRQYSRTLGI